MAERGRGVEVELAVARLSSTSAPPFQSSPVLSFATPSRPCVLELLDEFEFNPCTLKPLFSPLFVHCLLFVFFLSLSFFSFSRFSSSFSSLLAPPSHHHQRQQQQQEQQPRESLERMEKGDVKSYNQQTANRTKKEKKGKRNRKTKTKKMTTPTSCQAPSPPPLFLFPFPPAPSSGPSARCAHS